MGDSKKYDLEGRTLIFAKRTNNFVNRLPRTLLNIENGKQLIRSAGSIGANYIEANESLGKKDLLMRIKISRKEAKESAFWINLVESDKTQINERLWLLNESVELTKIFGAIYRKLS